MTNPAWKRSERHIAALIGGRRVPVSGRARGDQPDIEHPRLSVEVKTRVTLPAWLLGAMRQAEAASRDGRLPVVILHQSGDRYDDALCVMRLGDVAALLGELEDEPCR